MFLMIWRETVRRPPKGHDVVVALPARWYLHQLHRARTPIPFGFDPRAGAPLVLIFEILKIDLLPRTLYQAEALGRLSREGRCLQLDRVRQLPEDLLTRARVDHQAVRIVHLGTIVIEAAAVGLVKEKHRCQGCDPNDAHFG